MTVHKESRTYTGNRLNPVLMHVLASEQESHRALLTPDEAMRLPDDAALVFVAGARPILATKLRYFESKEFTRRAAIPAPVRPDLVAPEREESWRGPSNPIAQSSSAPDSADALFGETRAAGETRP